MNLQQALRKVVERQSLTRDEMTAAMRDLMTGQGTPAQVAGFLVALRMKGETVDEITGAAQVMRELATPVSVAESFRDKLVDTCGTGGDGASLFNISTASAFVVAAAGGHVAKHGNRSVSGTSGSADVLEAAGVKLDLAPAEVALCIENIGVGFMFAPSYHAAMKHAIGPRREMAVRTMFNVLGPLTNPAGARRQVIGVFDAHWLRPLAEVLKELGATQVMIVHSDDGLDEISIAAPTQFAELRHGQIQTGTLSPAMFGIKAGDLSSLKVDGAQQSLELIRAALNNIEGPAKDIVVLNSAAAIYTAGLADDFKDAVDIARNAIASGQAAQRLEDLANYSQKFGSAGA